MSTEHAAEKKRILLMTESLKKSEAAERCLQTAGMLQPAYDVDILIFDREGVKYDVKGLHIIHVDAPRTEGFLGNLLCRWRRVKRTKRVKTGIEPAATISFDEASHDVNAAAQAGDRIILYLNTEAEVTAHVAHRADLVLTPSKTALDALRERTGQKNNTCLYPAIDADRVLERARTGEIKFPFPEYEAQTVVSVFTREDPRAIKCLLDAFTTVVKEMESMRLLILTEGNPEQYRQEVKARNLERRTEVLRLPEDVTPYLFPCSIYVEMTDQAAFPKTMTEAMALSKAVIAQEVTPAIREILLSKEDAEMLTGAPDWKKIYATYGVLLPGISGGEKETAAATLAYEILSLHKDMERLRTYQLKSGERAAQFSAERLQEGWKTILTRLGV